MADKERPVSRRKALKLSGISTVGLLAGCLGGNGGSSTSTPTSVETSNGSSPTETGDSSTSTPTSVETSNGSSPTETSGSSTDMGTISGSPTVKWLTHFNSETETFNGIIDHFNEKYPNVTIDLRQVTPQKLVQQFSTSLGTSNAADIWGKGPGPGELGQFVDRGIPLNLDEHIDNSLFDKLAYTSSGLYEDENPLSWKSSDGSHYALPIAGFGNCYWYNKKVLADLDISEDELKGRSDVTWNTFIDMCKKAKNSGYTPIVMGGSDNIKNLGQWVGASFYKQVGVDVMLGTTLGRTDQKLNDKPFVEALKKYQSLYDKEYINQSVTAITRAQSVNLFYQGEALFYFQGSYMPNQINRMVGEDAPPINEKIGHFWHPYYPKAYKNGKNELYGFVGDVMSINKQSTTKRDNVKATVAFFEHFFSKESQQALFKNGGTPVARLDAWTDLTPEQEIQRQVVKEIKNAEKTYPAVPGSFLPQTREAFLSGIGNLFSGKDPQKIMDSVQSAQKQALKQYN